MMLPRMLLQRFFQSWPRLKKVRQTGCGAPIVLHVSHGILTRIPSKRMWLQKCSSFCKHCGPGTLQDEVMLKLVLLRIQRGHCTLDQICAESACFPVKSLLFGIISDVG